MPPEKCPPDTTSATEEHGEFALPQRGEAGPHQTPDRPKRIWNTWQFRATGAAAVLGSIAIAIGTLSDTSPRRPAPPHARPVPTRDCHNPATKTGVDAPLSVIGKNVVDAEGKRYTPYGISVYGGLEQNDPLRWAASDRAQITAAASYWHANTVRLQVAEKNLFTDVPSGYRYNPRFLAALQQEVSLAKRLGMRTAINDQTEFTDPEARNPGPRSADFWRIVSRQFACQPNVELDLFNEPRLEHDGNPSVMASPEWVWKLWHDGGTVHHRRFLGMQTLVNLIRGQGIKNLIWVETPYMSNGFNGLRGLNRHQITGGNIVEAYHHIDLNHLGKSEAAIDAIAKSHAVVDGEWAQYASRRPECYSKAYTNAPLYLRYLRNHRIGLIGWALKDDSLTHRGNEHQIMSDLAGDSAPATAILLSTPTEMRPDYACDDAHMGQGAGQLLMRYFAANSVPNSPGGVSPSKQYVAMK